MSLGNLTMIYLSENMKWKLWQYGTDILETLKLWKFGTLRTRTKETNENQGTDKPINFSSKGIPNNTPQHTDSHACTRTPSWGTRANLGDSLRLFVILCRCSSFPAYVFLIFQLVDLPINTFVWQSKAGGNRETTLKDFKEKWMSQ